jgi:hypothetical protein
VPHSQSCGYTAFRTVLHAFAIVLTNNDQQRISYVKIKKEFIVL